MSSNGSTIQSHHDLIVWQKAMDLAVEVHRLAATFPRAEQYRLVDQLTRAASSVPANIAEGHARSTGRDFANFLAVAKGSLMETDTFLRLAVRLDHVTQESAAVAFGLIDEVSRMLSFLRSRILKSTPGRRAVS